MVDISDRLKQYDTLGTVVVYVKAERQFWNIMQYLSQSMQLL